MSSQVQNQLESLETYNLIADKLIARFGQPWMYDDRYKSILIANLVQSDIDYSPELGASLQTYRYGGWKYAKMKMLQLRKRERNLVSLNSISSKEGPLYSRVASNESEPVEIIEQHDAEVDKTHLIDSILNNDQLTDVEKNYLKLIYQQGLSHNVIAQRLGVTKQAVSFTEQKALRKLREIYVGTK